jgi:small-conductance mechanosensitive channel
MVVLGAVVPVAGWWDGVGYALGVVGAAVVIGLVLHAVGAWLLRRVALREGSPIGAALAGHARAPARVVIVLAAVQVALLSLEQPARGLEPARHVVALGLIAASAWLVVRLSRVVDWGVEAYFKGDAGDELRARRVRTRVRVVRRVIAVVVWVVAAASMLMTFPRAWQLGASLLASAGIVGLVVGIAARPVLSNLIAGVQIAMTQPIRLEDAVVMDGQFGWVEEITATYVVLRTREGRRWVVPVTFFVERGFENWTRVGDGVVGVATVVVDKGVDVERLREGLRGILERSGRWDGRVWGLEVSGVTGAGVEVRAVMGAGDAAGAWELQGVVREGLLRIAREVGA